MLSKSDTTPQSLVTRLLHWLVAMVVLGGIGFGFYITTFSHYHLMGLHKSLGVLAGILFLSRFIWRLIEGFPKAAQAGLSAVIARSVHWLLLVLTILMPISGIVMSIASGRGLNLFQWTLFKSSPDAMNPGKFLPLNGDLAAIAHSFHVIAPWVLIALIALHVMAALRHHFILKDHTLKNMMGLR